MGERQLDRLPVNDSEPEVIEILLSLYFAHTNNQINVSSPSNNNKLTRIRNFCGRYCEG